MADKALDVNKPLLYKLMALRFLAANHEPHHAAHRHPLPAHPRANRLVVNMFYCVGVTGVIFISTFVIFQMAGTN